MKKKSHFFSIGLLVLTVTIICAVSVVVVLDIKQGKAEGLAFAKTYDRDACVQEVITGKRICTEVSCFFKNRAFYQTCMAEAKPSARLCNGITTTFNLFQFEMWKNPSVKKRGVLIEIVTIFGRQPDTLVSRKNLARSYLKSLLFVSGIQYRNVLANK